LYKNPNDVTWILILYHHMSNVDITVKSVTSKEAYLLKINQDQWRVIWEESTTIPFYDCQRMLEGILKNIRPYKQFLLLGNAKCFLRVD